MAVKAILSGGKVITENTDAARELFKTSKFGALLPDQRVELSMLEALYLEEKKRIMVFNGSKKQIPIDDLLKKARKGVKDFWVRYCVFKDLRNRGYIVKTALKFGADFRVYDKGIKPGEDHAKWIVFPSSEKERFTWQEFSAKNRVAHSTKKNLLLAIVDDEGDVSYWETRWLKP